MTERIAKIERTRLGYEGHGIFTLSLAVKYGASGQSIGGYALDTPVKREGQIGVERQGTAYGMEFIRRTMAACGVEQWEKVVGRTILVIADDDDRVLGIAPLPTERGRPFLFDEIKDFGKSVD